MDKVQAGGSFKIFRVDYEAASPYGNDTPYSPVPGVDPFALVTEFRAYQTGAYLQATKGLSARLSVTAGLRVDNYDYLGDTRVSPRAGRHLSAGPDALLERQLRALLPAAARSCSSRRFPRTAASCPGARTTT